MSSKDLPKTISSYNTSASSLVMSRLDREALELAFFSLRTSEETPATVDRRRAEEIEKEEEKEEWDSLWVDPRKKEEVLRGLEKRGL